MKAGAPLPRLGYVALHMDSYFAERHGVFEQASRGLTRLAAEEGFEIVFAPQYVVSQGDAALVRRFMEAMTLDALVIHFAACSTCDPVLELSRLGCPIVLWAVPEPTPDGPVQLNSFVAMQIAASAIHRRRSASTSECPAPYKCLFGDITERSLIDRLMVTVRALRARAVLRESRIGLIGGVAPGFENLSYDPNDVRSRIGPQFFQHDLRELLTDVHRESTLTEVTQEMRDAARTIGVSDADLRQSAIAYVNLRRLVQAEGYDALAVRDWPELQEIGHLSPLLAMAWLSEHHGIPVCCEGDALGAVTLVALAAIAGTATTLLDVGPAHGATDRLLVWHLGSSPLAFADSHGVTYQPHSTLGRADGRSFGTVVEQVFGPGVVTLANLSDGGRELLVAGGRLIDGPTAGPSGDRGWLCDPEINRVPVSVTQFLHTGLVRGLGHHYGLVRGSWQDEVSELGTWLGLRRVDAVELRQSLQVDTGWF